MTTRQNKALAINKKRAEEIQVQNTIKWTYKYSDFTRKQVEDRIKQLEANNPKIPGISHPINQFEINFLKALLILKNIGATNT